MTTLRAALALTLCCLACDKTATTRTDTAAAVSVTSSSSPAVAPVVESDESEEGPLSLFDPPDSSTVDWHISSGHDPRFGGRNVRHPSGLLVIYMDSATRATEDAPKGRANVDSVVVTGLLQGELVAPFCKDAGGIGRVQVVGVVRDSSRYVQPRLAWMLDTMERRIISVPPGAYVCTAAPLFYTGE